MQFIRATAVPYFQSSYVGSSQKQLGLIIEYGLKIAFCSRNTGDLSFFVFLWTLYYSTLLAPFFCNEGYNILIPSWILLTLLMDHI